MHSAAISADRNQIWYRLIHTNLRDDTVILTLTDLNALIEKLSAAIPDLDLDGEDIEEYSTMLLWLQNQVETGEPSERIVDECLAYFRRFESIAA